MSSPFVTMDTLLHELRRHMAELSIQGDDFTRQMWQMYAVFEELLERQLGSTGNSRSPRRSETSNRRFNPSDSCEGSSSLDDFDVWSMAVVAPQELDDVDDPFSVDDFDSDSHRQELRHHRNINEELLNHLEAAFQRQLILGGGAKYASDGVLERSGHSEDDTNRHAIPHHHYRRRHHSLHKDYALKQEHEAQQQQQRSVRRHYKHGHRRRLPATPTVRHHQQSHGIQSLVPSCDVQAEHLTRSSPAVNVESPTEFDDSNESLSSSFTLAKQQQSSVPYRRSSAPELLDNPLLETISTIEDMCESDDYGELPHDKRSSCGARDERTNGLGISDKDGFSMGKTSLSGDERAQPVSDGDRDSVGYAGSNSVDSGYKSSCPTPELLDPCYYAQDALCGGSSSSANKRALLSSAIRASRETKPRIPMGTRVIGRHARSSSTPWSTLLSTSSCSSSSSGGGATSGGEGCSTPNRLEYGYYDVNLDHLMYLRQSLLSAIQKCGGSVSSLHASPSDSECSGVVTSNTCASTSNPSGSTSRCGTDGSSIHTSPARSRSGSRTSQGSPDPTKGTRLRFASEYNYNSSTVVCSVSEFDAIGHSASNDDDQAGICNLPSLTSSSSMASPSCPRLAEDCSEGSALRSIRMTENDSIGLQIVMSKTPSVSTVNDVDCVAVSSISNEEMETVLFDRAEYYDLESVEDFPCSYGTVLENKYIQSSVARVKKLRVDPKCDDLKSNRSSSCSKPASEQSLSQRALPQASNSETCDPPKHEHCVKSDKVVANMALHAIHAEDHCNQNLNSTSPFSSSKSQNGKMSVLSDSAVDQVRFSQVASCMLKIIDDLHQHQQHCPKKTQGSTISTTLPYRAKLASSSPAIYDSQRLSGADYHVYEEIAYDLINRGDGKPPQTFQGQRVIERRGADSVPPPLPARPNEIFGTTLASSPTKILRPSKVANSKPISQFLLEPKVPEQRNKANLNKRGNLYSLFTEQSDRRHLSQSLEKEWQTSNPAGGMMPSIPFSEVSNRTPGTCNRPTSHVAAASSTKEYNDDDDEYGFNAVAK